MPWSVESLIPTQRPGFDTRLGRVDPGGPMVIILATGSAVRGFKPGRGRWMFSERKNLEHDFLRKGSKAMGPVS